MLQLITKNYNGFLIEFELIDDQLMANATAMCAAFGKEPYSWLRGTNIKRYIDRLEALREINGVLVETRNGGSNPGTWIHERLILKLAQWLDVDFEIQCDQWIAELLRTGKVELQPALPQSQAELILMLAQQNVETERRIAAVEQQNLLQQQQVQQIEQQVQQVVAQVTTINTDYYSVAGWAALCKKPIPISTANGIGRRAANLSRKEGVPIGSVYDARYGQVGTYHRDILQRLL